MANKLYQRLPGRSNGLVNSTMLWEAQDHLLMVISYRASESYRRFYYRDIQAIAICRTNTMWIAGGITGLLALLLGLVGLSMVRDGADQGVAGALAISTASVLLCAALWNFALGPTCRCTVQTAVQVQPLPTLGRLRRARRVTARLRAKIEAAQQEAAGTP